MRSSTGKRGEEVVVDEHTAAFLLRDRAAEVIEVIGAPPTDEPT